MSLEENARLEGSRKSRSHDAARAGGNGSQVPDGELKAGCARLFRRREEKYEIGLGSAAFLREEIARRLPLFEYNPGHAYTHVTTLYFDTRDRHFFHEAVRDYRNHLRIRVKEYYYARAAGERKDFLISPYCFVELKETIDGAVVKRRFAFPKRDLSRLFRREEVWPILLRISPPHELGPLHDIYCEFRKFISDYPVEPTSIVHYRRVVYQRTEEDLRITFDDQLAVYPPVLDLYDRIEALTPDVLGKPVRKADRVILEIKCAGEHPEWLRSALQYHSSKRLSKFTTSMRFLLGDETRPAEGAGRTAPAAGEDDTTLSAEALR
jgi:hypothetical protein